jgi:hypothetical protein
LQQNRGSSAHAEFEVAQAQVTIGAPKPALFVKPVRVPLTTHQLFLHQLFLSPRPLSSHIATFRGQGRSYKLAVCEIPRDDFAGVVTMF